MSPASLSGWCLTTASDLPVSVTKSEQLFPVDCLYTQAEIYAAKALLSLTGLARNPESASQQDHKQTLFPRGVVWIIGLLFSRP